MTLITLCFSIISGIDTGKVKYLVTKKSDSAYVDGRSISCSRIYTGFPFTVTGDRTPPIDHLAD